MELDQPLGDALDWTPARRPQPTTLRGAHVLLRPPDPEADAEPLWEVSRIPGHWTYLPDGPYETPGQLRRMLTWAARSEDPFYFTIAPLPRSEPAGIASYLRIAPEHGTIEIGHIWFGTALRRTPAATEAIFLLARHAFDELGYRRLEWKCDALNAPSRRAAERFGFTFEGVFRKHMVVKGRNRDTAWFAITDDDWPPLRAAFEAWLAPANFEPDGAQKRTLSDLRAAQ
jgi:RimJ/RimL family protein N-acetyltransferase